MFQNLEILIYFIVNCHSTVPKAIFWPINCETNYLYILQVFTFIILASYSRYHFLVQAQQMVYLSCFSIGIMAAILLIHGAFKLNRFLLIYWIVVAVLRIVLQSSLILEIFYYHILDSLPYEYFYTSLEIMDFGLLTA